ncbi:MAG TPA: hypothetical protein VG272_08140, partial [Candidatus Acidoferrales bacterium]|nr:hypothetical protein [Candidatus Acidoferrales bacterium]
PPSLFAQLPEMQLFSFFFETSESRRKQLNIKTVYNNGNFAMAVDHTLFKVRLNSAGQPDFEHVAPNNKTEHWYLDETGKLAVVREVTYARVFVKKDGKWRPAVGASATLPMSK